MSLHPHIIEPVPEETARVARAAFPKGHPYLTFRDALGTIFQDEDFAALFPAWGQPGLPPWRLALVTIMQFRENLADRQAAEAVRARIDWKYLLSLELTDPGFDFSVLSEFRDRLLAGSAEELLLDKLLERCRAMGWLKARGQQRTDSTHVLAAIRVLNRLELVAETLRAALNAVATIAPDWLQAVTPLAWYERYSRRIEESRLPKDTAAREAYAHTVGEDGFRFLDLLETPEAPAGLRELPHMEALRRTWQRHYERTEEAPASAEVPAVRQVRFKENRELPPAAAGIESPYDVEARYRQKRDTTWTGYMVHVSETCEPTAPHLLTHVHTTPATVHEAQCTEPIQQALIEKEVPPREHLVDAAYISSELLVRSRDEQDIILRRAGHYPARSHPPEPGLASPGRGRVRPRAVCGGLGPAAGTLSPRAPVDGLVGARRGPGQSPDHCPICHADVCAVPGPRRVHPCQTPRPPAGAPAARRGGGRGRRSDLVCQCRRQSAVWATRGHRRDPLPGSACVWAAPDTVLGAGENPLAARRDCRCDQY